MFASIALAARIDRAEARLTESLGRAVMASMPESRAFVEAIGDGVAAYAGPSSPMNKMIGVGFEGVPSERRLQEIEDLFRERGAPLQAEIATLGDPAFAAELTRRGYGLRNFENVTAAARRARRRAAGLRRLGHPRRYRRHRNADLAWAA